MGMVEAVTESGAEAAHWNTSPHKTTQHNAMRWRCGGDGEGSGNSIGNGVSVPLTGLQERKK